MSDDALASARQPRPRNTLFMSFVMPLDEVDMEALTEGAGAAVFWSSHNINVDEELCGD